MVQVEIGISVNNVDKKWYIQWFHQFSTLIGTILTWFIGWLYNEIRQLNNFSNYKIISLSYPTSGQRSPHLLSICLGILLNPANLWGNPLCGDFGSPFRVHLWPDPIPNHILACQLSWLAFIEYSVWEHRVVVTLQILRSWIRNQSRTNAFFYSNHL